MLEITNLINQVAVIIQKNDEILELTGAKFNVFKLCGVYHYENVHSKIIAEFLNPKGSHGLQSKLLDCFIQTLSEKNLFSIANFDSKQAKVYTEYSTDQGRIDILIESQEKAIIIENKIYAYDQPEQLKRYQTFAKAKYQNELPNFQIFYLTLWGDQASEQSSNGVEYKCISYHDLIIKWLESGVSLAARLPALRESLIQYIQLLKQLTNQDMDSQTTNEILNVLAKKGNLQAAKAIYQNYQDVFKQIVNEHFSPKMEEFAKDNHLKYEFNSCQESHISFKFYKEDWNFWIGYYFEANEYFYGICNYDLETKKISEEQRKLIESKLKENNPQSSEWWPYYKVIDPLTIEIWEEKIINNDTFVKECLKELSFLLRVINES